MKQNRYMTYNKNAGMITPLILVMAAIFIVFGVSLINWAITGYKDTVRKVRKIQSLEVAEAGVSYYKWHLAHDSSDYKDGNNWCCNENPALTLADCGDVCGPYIHQYEDYNNDVIGEFSLRITPPETGSTVNTVESTGYAYGNAALQKKVTALVGKRSLAEYSFLTKAPIWIGLGESTSGPLHSNGGIRFDDTCTAEVTSAVSTYNCAGTGHDCTGVKPGIWGSGGPTTFWRFPVPAIDFDLFAVSLDEIRENAGYYDGDGDFICSGYSATNGICYEDSGAEGYLVKFNNDATVNIYKIDSLKPKVKYWNYEKLPSGGWEWEAEEIQNKTEMLGSPFNMPSNGLIFIEDDVWVEGTVNGKVTLAVARFPENPNNYAKIRINNNVQYLARDGNHNLGLMAQGDILVPRYAPANLTIDAVLLSQKGHVYFRDYNSWIVKNNIEVYGGIITNLFWTWSYTGGGVIVSGYNTTNTIYNNYLTFAPPPFFPTSENYEVLSWKEE